MQDSGSGESAFLEGSMLPSDKKRLLIVPYNILELLDNNNITSKIDKKQAFDEKVVRNLI